MTLLQGRIFITDSVIDAGGDQHQPLAVRRLGAGPGGQVHRRWRNAAGDIGQRHHSGGRDGRLADVRRPGVQAGLGPVWASGFLPFSGVPAHPRPEP